MGLDWEHAPLLFYYYNNDNNNNIHSFYIYFVIISDIFISIIPLYQSIIQQMVDMWPYSMESLVWTSTTYSILNS